MVGDHQTQRRPDGMSSMKGASGNGTRARSCVTLGPEGAGVSLPQDR